MNEIIDWIMSDGMDLLIIICYIMTIFLLIMLPLGIILIVVSQRKRKKNDFIKSLNEASFISMPKDEPVIITWNSKNFKNNIHRDLPRDSKGRFVKRTIKKGEI